jgi:hypothetical protein
VTIGSNDIVSGAEAALDVTYEESYIDADDLAARFSRFHALPIDVHLAMSRRGAGFVSALANNGVTRFTPPGTASAVSVADAAYVIAGTADLRVRTDLTALPVTQHEAASLLQAHVAGNPADAGTVQVVPAHEVVP